ncbi:MAG TPA: prolyl oligopeptidase family serine peptidase [Gemmatimonadaceae bacterium]|nr:prolyl oligopeptidase family serine peptidase [Gemmatimonadaceae bacterium]
MRAYLIAALALLLPLSAETQQPPTVITPAENLVVDGVPAIPARLAAEVRRYTESRAATLADWHPARRELLISTRFGNTAQIHRLSAPLGSRTQLTFFDEPITGASYDPRQGRYFLFTRDIGGNEFRQIYRYDVASGAVTLLTDGGRSQNGGIVWSTRGDRVAYGSTRRNGTDRDIYVMDPLNPGGGQRLLEVQGGGWGAVDWSPDDRQLLVGEYLSVNQSRLHLVDAPTGRRSLLIPESRDTVAYGDALFSRDGRGVYVTTDAGSEFLRLAYVDLATRRVTPLTTSINWDIDRFDLSADGRAIAFVANEAGVARLYLLDTRSRRIRPVSGVPVGTIRAVKWHPRLPLLAFSVSSSRSPSDVYSLDARTGSVTRWTESELGGLVASDLSSPSLIRWRSFDGLEITGFYYRPPARFTGRRPVIINIHGGPEGQYLPGFLGRTNYYLNELGVAVIFPNVRGSTGYGKEFVKLDNGMKREDSVRDIGALLDWIGQQPELDARRVMVTGGSYGGYMTLAVATNYNDRICCALDVVGISNFNTFLRNTESYRRDLRRVEYGDERDPRMSAFFERIAPLNNAGRISRPLFVIQGANDPRVPFTEAEQIVARVKQNGSPVWYLKATDEGHGFRKKTNVDFQFYSTVEFIRRYLLGTGSTALTP